MNYLALCNRLILECGISAQPMTVTVGNTGELQRVATWINQAWLELQEEHQDWQWMRHSASFETVAGQAEYMLDSDIILPYFGRWATQTFRNYDTAATFLTEIFMDPIDYEVWRNSYYYGALRTTQTRPLQFAIGPAKQVCLGPVPAAGYTVTCDYYSRPSELVNNLDTPELPSQFHMAIVYKAMQYYGMFESAPEVMQRGQVEYERMLRRIAIDRLPQIQFAGALA